MPARCEPAAPGHQLARQPDPGDAVPVHEDKPALAVTAGLAPENPDIAAGLGQDVVRLYAGQRRAGVHAPPLRAVKAKNDGGPGVGGQGPDVRPRDDAGPVYPARQARDALPRLT